MANVKLSDAVAALDEIARWTNAVHGALDEYVTKGGDIDLTAKVKTVGGKSNKKASTARAAGVGVGKDC